MEHHFGNIASISGLEEQRQKVKKKTEVNGNSFCRPIVVDSDFVENARFVSKTMDYIYRQCQKHFEDCLPNWMKWDGNFIRIAFICEFPFTKRKNNN